MGGTNGDLMHQPRDTNGRYIDFEKYIDTMFAEREKQMERIFAERETSAEFKRISLELALNEAKSNIEKELGKAKVAADEVADAMKTRLALLESGGAPFASRLDESLTELKEDVGILNENMVKTTVLDALREQTEKDALTQKKQVRLALGTAGAALIIIVVEFILRLVAS